MNADQSNVGSDPVILATAGYDHTIRFWQAHSGVCIRTVQHQDSQVNALEITPDRTLIAAAGYQHIRMYDLNANNPNPVISYDGISKNVSSLGFHEDGRWMYTGGEDCTTRIWDLRSRYLQCQRILQVSAPITCVFLHPNQAESTLYEHLVQCVNVGTEESKAARWGAGHTNLQCAILALVMDAINEIHFWVELIVADQSGAIHIWDLRTDHNEPLIPKQDVAVNCVHINPDASYLAAVTSTGKCYVWNLLENPTNVSPKKEIDAHDSRALKCRFSPDSTLLATCSSDQTCTIWRMSDFEKHSKLSIHSSNPAESSRGWMWDCAFSGDSQYMVTASSDNTARLWSVDTGEIKLEYTGHQKAIVCLAFNDSVA